MLCNDLLEQETSVLANDPMGLGADWSAAYLLRDESLAFPLFAEGHDVFIYILTCLFLECPVRVIVVGGKPATVPQRLRKR